MKQISIEAQPGNGDRMFSARWESWWILLRVNDKVAKLTGTMEETSRLSLWSNAQTRETFSAEGSFRLVDRGRALSDHAPCSNSHWPVSWLYGLHCVNSCLWVSVFPIINGESSHSLPCPWKNGERQSMNLVNCTWQHKMFPYCLIKQNGGQFMAEE